jgi:hypothetical protein
MLIRSTNVAFADNGWRIAEGGIYSSVPVSRAVKLIEITNGI